MRRERVWSMVVLRVEMSNVEREVEAEKRLRVECHRHSDDV